MRHGERRTIPELDGIRGLAILLVFLTHFVAIRLPRHGVMADDVVRWVARFGWTGVDLFFVLSGFLITGILLDTKGRPNYWRNYAARRCLRIFPLYYGALVLVIIVLPATHWNYPPLQTLRDNQAWYWTYTVNFLEVLKGRAAVPMNTSHFWSLCIEEQFYLLWPLVVLLVSRAAILRIAIGVGFVGLAFRWWLVHTTLDPAAAYVLTPGRLDGLMIGAVLAVKHRDGGLGRLRPLAVAVTAAGAALIGGFALWRGMEYEDPVMAVAGFPVIAAVFGGFLVLGLTSPGPLSRFLSFAPLRSWGKYSYGLYLIHFPLIGVLDVKLAPHLSRLVWHGSQLLVVLVFCAVGIPLSYGVAWLSYHVYEKRFLALKRYFD
jgi:peptidoglycan/LPS O-acetylase OafA/YrhL